MPFDEGSPLYTEGFKRGIDFANSLIASGQGCRKTEFLGSIADEANIARDSARIAESSGAASYLMGIYDGMMTVYWTQLIRLERKKSE